MWEDAGLGMRLRPRRQALYRLHGCATVAAAAKRCRDREHSHLLRTPVGLIECSAQSVQKPRAVAVFRSFSKTGVVAAGVEKLDGPEEF